MSLPVLIAAVATIFGITLLIIFYRTSSKDKQIIKKLQKTQKNHEYLLSNLRDVIDIAGFGQDAGIVIDILLKNIEEIFPYSTISSIYIKKAKLIFRSTVRETVNQEFINRIKDNMLTSLNTSTPSVDGITPTEIIKNIKFDNDSIEETISGVPLDALGASEIKSTNEIKLSIYGQIHAIINISSTADDLYSEADKTLFADISSILSELLTRIELLLNLEKSKSLAMIDSFSEGIFMIDRDFELISMNNSARNFLKIVNPTPTVADILSSLPNTFNFKERIQECIQKNEQIEKNDVTINNKIFKVILTPVLEVNTLTQNVIGASILLHDVTLEKSLAQTKEDFTNVMVHELRSPLTAIKASSDFLTSTADLTEPEKKRLIEMISISSKKMLDEISLILDSAKMDAGLFTIRKTDSDLKKLITDRIAVFTPVAAEKSINLKTEIDPSLPTFSFDPVRIDEVINNLLSNSLKFTPIAGTISVHAYVEADSAIVSVSDTGEGIAKDKQSKLFSKFQQAPSDGAHVGTGLGLYVVKQVVEAHNGKITLVSEPGQGTTISFTLPLTGAVKSDASFRVPSKSPEQLVN